MSEDYKSRTIASYDKHIDFYDTYLKGLFNLYRRGEFGKFLEAVPRGAKVLDLGCGTGDHAAYFEQQGLNVKCIDLSEEMVGLCKRKGLDAEVMDIEDLKFEDDSFDAVWAVTSLLHIPKRNLSSVLSKISDILKPEGILYVCVKEGEGERFVPDKHDGSTERFFSYWREEELCDTFGEYFILDNFERKRFKKSKFFEAFFRNEK